MDSQTNELNGKIKDVQSYIDSVKFSIVDDINNSVDQINDFQKKM